MPSSPTPLVAPHGGHLVDQRLSPQAAQALLATEPPSAQIQLSMFQLADVEMLATGAMSPLTGFMNSRDRARVAREMRLEDGTLWPIPITLQLPEAVAASLKLGTRVGLQNSEGSVVAVLDVEEIYARDAAEEARAIFGTDEVQHPGVAALLEGGAWCVAGRVQTLIANVGGTLSVAAMTPQQTRAVFAERGWQRIVGFQTRNPIHRAHEYIIKCAMETADGLLLHPLVGATKGDDIPAPVRLKCYEALLDCAMPKERVCLSVLGAAMRYAGPKEAVLHAIMRQNYGCSHFIVGRDHAGVANYYGTYDAQRIFANLPEGLRIMPLFFENAFFCRRCAQMATDKTCPHNAASHVSLSGSKVREMLRGGERPPPEFSRPEVADILIKWAMQ
jgi:sulfate adenylyltransferase